MLFSLKENLDAGVGAGSPLFMPPTDNFDEPVSKAGVFNLLFPKNI